MFHDTLVYFHGKLSASSRKEAENAVRQAGGKIARALNPQVKTIVVGEEELLRQDWNQWNDILDEQTREAFENGQLKIIAETTFWEIIHKHETYEPVVITAASSDTALYTPVMLAELTNLPVSYIRRLEKQNVIFPQRKVHQLSYFGFENIAPLKLFRKMLDIGFSFQKSLRRIQQIKPQLFTSPLDVIVAGNKVLFQTNSGLLDTKGQKHFGFHPEEVEESGAEAPASLAELCEAAWDCESSGRLQDALNLYRAALASGGANALINFQTAELLYRMGDLTAARERYFTAIELDEHFVEARANLGCVLAELGETQLAESAFRGALEYHPKYAEVHYHLSELLRKNGKKSEAEEHLRIFMELAPNSPLLNLQSANLTKNF
ncbi:MAG: tetratricopeptide repeat protein [Planctomycetaceae bacterium]|nr:tetratricopeptide repeat protein [Planctomycetaceae bacterium]